MPDVGDVAGEQRPGFAPVGTVVVQNLAGAFRLGRASLVAPGRIILRHGADRSPSAGPTSPSRRPTTSAAVLSPQIRPVAAQLPEIARTDTGDRQLRNIVLALDRAVPPSASGSRSSVQIVVADAQERQVEILGQQPRDLVAQRGLVPFAQFRQLVVGDPICPAFRPSRWLSRITGTSVRPSMVAASRRPCPRSVRRRRRPCRGTVQPNFSHAGGDLRHLVGRHASCIAGIGRSRASLDRPTFRSMGWSRREDETSMGRRSGCGETKSAREGFLRAQFFDDQGVGQWGRSVNRKN